MINSNGNHSPLIEIRTGVGFTRVWLKGGWVGGLRVEGGRLGQSQLHPQNKFEVILDYILPCLKRGLERAKKISWDRLI